MFQFTLSASSVDADRYLGYSDYHIITDRNFNPGPYLQSMAENGVNLQRIWITGYSGSARDVDEVMPFTQRGKKYQLTARLNPQYLRRLERVMKLADQYGQRVMLTMFDRWSLAREFQSTPWFHKNNHEKLLKNALPDFYSLKNKKLMRIQEALVRTIVRNTKEFNPIYEVMNEAAGANCQQLSEWHGRVSSWILDEFPSAEIGVNLLQECPQILDASWVDIVSFHQNVWEKQGICESVRNYPQKHVIIDTDGAWKVRDDNRLVKEWLQEAISCGGSFNHKDNIYEIDREFLQLYREQTR